MTILKALSLAGCLLLLPSCLVSKHSESVTDGTVISASTLAALSPGSTEGDALALLGPPSSRVQLSSGASVLTWTWTRSEKFENAVLFIVHQKGTTTSTGSISITVADGVITEIKQSEKSQ